MLLENRLSSNAAAYLGKTKTLTTPLRKPQNSYFHRYFQYYKSHIVQNSFVLG